jgi:transcriptional regulator with XRE-family HTH domain
MKLDIYRIKSEMAQKGYKQYDLADRAGVSKQLMSYWLKNPRNISVKTVGRIAGALGIDGKDLIISDNKTDKNG